MNTFELIHHFLQMLQAFPLKGVGGGRPSPGKTRRVSCGTPMGSADEANVGHVTFSSIGTLICPN